MKIISYNTLFGGCDGSIDQRLQLQIALIQAEKPDILFLQEARHFDREGQRRLHQLEKAWDMRGFLALAPHTGLHAVIFIRAPILPVAFESDAVHFHHTTAFLTVELPGFAAPVTLINTHLCPYGPQVRQLESAYLTKYAAPDRLTLLGGDFNSLSPHDAEPDWSQFSRHAKSRYFMPAQDRADRFVLQTLQDAGYTDVAWHLNGSSQHTLPTRGFERAVPAAFRFDYLLVNAPLVQKLVSYKVLRNDQTDQASDHYPLVAEIKF